MTRRPERRRVLFYGGCHAGALQRIFRKYGTESEVDYDLLVNFKIIPSGKPFPLERLASYAAVVMSPVLNKPGYNTDMVLEACGAAGVPAVVYPWIEWRGYHPYAVKRPFMGGTHWVHRIPLEPGQETGPAFEQALALAMSDRGAVHDLLERTTQALRHNETRGACTLTLSEFILDNYRRQRLFLTPDHAAKPLYRYLVAEVSRQIGIGIAPEFYASNDEPQAGKLTPILPAVAQALDLDFMDPEFRTTEGLLAGRTVHGSEYLELLGGSLAGMGLWQAKGRTRLKRRPVASAALGADEWVELQAGDTLQAATVLKQDGHLEVRPVWAHRRGSGRLRLPAWDSAFLFTQHWAPLSEEG